MPYELYKDEDIDSITTSVRSNWNYYYDLMLYDITRPVYVSKV